MNVCCFIFHCAIHGIDAGMVDGIKYKIGESQHDVGFIVNLFLGHH